MKATRKWQIPASVKKKDVSSGGINMKASGKAVDAVRAADAAWLKAYTARDLDKSVEICDVHGSMLVPNAPMVTGKKAIAKLIAAGFALPDYKLTWHPNKAGVARSGELGYTSGTYKWSFKDASGKTFSDKGKYLMVWKKQADGAWKLLFDMNNSDLPSTSRR
ncbi:MAG: nuclear transport factor 2 family protein [Candidatus Acidiferrales bacterium]